MLFIKVYYIVVIFDFINGKFVEGIIVGCFLLNRIFI